MFLFESFKSYVGMGIVPSVSPVWPEAIEQVTGGGIAARGEAQHEVEMQFTSCWAAAWVFGPSGIYK